MDMGFVRVAAVVPELQVADVCGNTKIIKALIQTAVDEGSDIIVFPELCITGYSCADLFYQETLVTAAAKALVEIASIPLRTSSHIAPVLHSATGTLVVVGLPMMISGRLYNCAAVINDHKVIGIIPKTYLPNRAEFYEGRWFAPATILDESPSVFEFSDAVIGIEICEDVWAPIPPSSYLAIAGANILVNLSASDEVLGKYEYRRELIKQQSARCIAGYVYVSAGPNESTTDVVYSGHSIIAENGTILAESQRYRFDSQIIYGDIDVQKLDFERVRNSSFSHSKPGKVRIKAAAKFLRDFEPEFFPLSKKPFVPQDATKRDVVCEEIFNIQTTALAKRLYHTKIDKVCIALSGGLDSTLALLVAVKTFSTMTHLPPLKNILAIGMPGPGSTVRTQDNAAKLAKLLGVSMVMIDIRDAISRHLKDIAYNFDAPSVAFENAQARERTQILFDIANDRGALAIGTGDLSESALGWCTYGGDHMSMYNVNCGIPKTLVKFIVDHVARSEYCGTESMSVLLDICNTPISPELLLPAKDGSIKQRTEDVIGPYVLNDFFLFYMVRYHFAPAKIFFLACKAFKGEFTEDTILGWLRKFYKRFFAAQFKRSAVPDGPKVGSVALSPRGDWRMPSDASVELWLKTIDEMKIADGNPQGR